MATIAEHIAATRDADLLARFVAAAEIAGIDAPQQWAETHRGELVAAQLDGDTTVSTVYAFAVASYKGRPGEDASYVTDAQISAAVAAIAATP